MLVAGGAGKLLAKTRALAMAEKEAVASGNLGAKNIMGPHTPEQAREILEQIAKEEGLLAKSADAITEKAAATSVKTADGLERAEDAFTANYNSDEQPDEHEPIGESLTGAGGVPVINPTSNHPPTVDHTTRTNIDHQSTASKPVEKPTYANTASSKVQIPTYSTEGLEKKYTK